MEIYKAVFVIVFVAERMKAEREGCELILDARAGLLVFSHGRLGRE